MCDTRSSKVSRLWDPINNMQLKFHRTTAEKSPCLLSKARADPLLVARYSVLDGAVLRVSILPNHINDLVFLYTSTNMLG
jgi:hypothetical protein